MNFFVWFFITFCLFFIIIFKASPSPPPKSAFLSIDFFFNLPHFIKTLKYSLWNVCSVLCAPVGATPPPSTRPGPPKSKAPHVWAWAGGAGGTLGIRTPGRSLQAALALGWGSPQPPPSPAPPPQCKSIYLVRASLTLRLWLLGCLSPQALTRPAPANNIPPPGRLLPQLK